MHDESDIVRRNVTYLNVVFEVAAIHGRGYLMMRRACEALGVPYAAQHKRLRYHARTNGLHIATIESEGATDIGLPLEEISWFLRTMRPSDPIVRHRIAPMRHDLALHLIRYFVTTLREEYARWDAQRKAATSREHAAKERSEKWAEDKARRDAAPNESRTKAAAAANRGSRFSIHDARQMKAAHQSGESYASIGRRYSCAAATVCLIVKDKYPVTLDDERH